MRSVIINYRFDILKRKRGKFHATERECVIVIDIFDERFSELVIRILLDGPVERILHDKITTKTIPFLS